MDERSELGQEQKTELGQEQKMGVGADQAEHWESLVLEHIPDDR